MSSTYPGLGTWYGIIWFVISIFTILYHYTFGLSFLFSQYCIIILSENTSRNCQLLKIKRYEFCKYWGKRREGAEGRGGRGLREEEGGGWGKRREGAEGRGGRGLREEEGGGWGKRREGAEGRGWRRLREEEGGGWGKRREGAEGRGGRGLREEEGGGWGKRREGAEGRGGRGLREEEGGGWGKRREGAEGRGGRGLREGGRGLIYQFRYANIPRLPSWEPMGLSTGKTRVCWLPS